MIDLPAPFFKHEFFKFISGDLFGGHVRLVFTLVLFIFVACVYITLTSFSEIPLDILASTSPEVSSATGNSTN